MADTLIFSFSAPPWQEVAYACAAEESDAEIVNIASLRPSLPVLAAPVEGLSLAVYESLKAQKPRCAVFACPPEYAFHTVQARQTGAEVPTNLVFPASIAATALLPEYCNLDGEQPLIICRALWCRRYVQNRAMQTQISTTVNAGQPLVSVCVTHYNHGDFLPISLAALAKQDYPALEVLVVDDGSTDVASQKIFAAMEQTYPGWRFFRQQNQGPGAARNFCAAMAQGDYLLFADADNISLPHMVTSLVRGMAVSLADALACHFWVFHEHPLTPLAIGAPQGGNLAAGMLENVFGDTNFIIKATVFRALGGFSTRLDLPEDWEFLARLNLAGYRQEVLPEPLFHYRERPEGRGRKLSGNGQRENILESYAAFMPEFATQAARELLLPLADQHIPLGRSKILRAAIKWGWKLELWYQHWRHAIR